MSCSKGIVCIQFIRTVVNEVCSEIKVGEVGDGDTSELIDRVIPKLKYWRDELKRLDELDDFRMKLNNALRKRAHALNASNNPNNAIDTRSEGSSASSSSSFSTLPSMAMTHRFPGAPSLVEVPKTLSATLVAINGLIECEREVIDSESAYEAADKHIQENPSMLVNKIVSHFKHLFDCKETTAVFPKMNRLFLNIQELQNFARCVRSTLRIGMPSLMTHMHRNRILHRSLTAR